MAYFRRLHFLLIFEKALTFLSDELDVFRMVSRYDNRRACITPYNSNMQFEYTIGTEIKEVSGTEEGRDLLKGAIGWTGGRENPPTFHRITWWSIAAIHRKPPEVRICRLRNQSAVGTRPPSTSTPH